MKLLGLFITISFTKDERRLFQSLDDYGEPFCAQQYTRESCLFICSNSNLLISLIPPNRLNFWTFTQLWHYSVIPCLSSGLAESNKILPMFVLVSRLFGDFESLAFFENGGTNLALKQSTRTFLVNFSKVQQLSNNFSKKWRQT